MQIAQILIFIAAIVVARTVTKDSLYKWALFLISLFSLFWFQPVSPIRNLDFWLPSLTTLFAIVSWVVIFKDIPFERESIAALSVTLVFLFAVGVMGFLNITFLQSVVSSPGILGVSALVFVIVIFFLLKNKFSNSRGFFSKIIISIILTLFVVLKSDGLAAQASGLIRGINGQLTTLANSSEISWVGYSYFSFRLLHTLIDRRQVRELKLSLREYFTYLVFFPAYIAGPIDRIEHFSSQLRDVLSGFHKDDFLDGVVRITRGIFFKFIVADNLALFSLNPSSVGLIKNTLWAWIIVYCYALRIFMDFAGYTDIAIGLGQLAGIRLPENFHKPYASRNVTMFWNNWHITLTQWFRTYYFNPVTRFFRSRFQQIKPWLIILGTQMTTMILIGLWHGISWNFVIWGAWNGLGLFFHNRWSAAILPKFDKMRQLLDSKIILAISIFLTFNYIALGWVWFALPTPEYSIVIFKRLLGF